MEVDLQERYNLDLATEWASRRWRRLLNLIDHLPRNSHYAEAVVNDEEMAELQAADIDPSEKPKEQPPPLREWSIEAELLARIADRVGVEVDATIASAGGKPIRMGPVMRPETAIDRKVREARERNRIKIHESLVAQLLPGRVTTE